MAHDPSQPVPRFAELSLPALEANYGTYLRTLRLLVAQGYSLLRIQRSLCWIRLQHLHQGLPGKYREPDLLYQELRANVHGGPRRTRAARAGGTCGGRIRRRTRSPGSAGMTQG